MTELPPLENAVLPPGIRSRFVHDINGLRMHVLEAGFESTGRPCVLLLHGFPELAYSWRKVMAPLASAGFHVVAPDQRGYGRTTGWDPDYDGDLRSFRLLNLVRDSLGLVSALGYRSVAAVVGHDFGAGVAWLIASVESARVDKVVVLAVGHPGAVSRPLFKQMQLSWYSFFFQFEGTAEAALMRDEWSLFREWLASSPDIDRSVEAMNRPGALEAGLSWYRTNMRPEIWGTDIPFPPVSAPTMGIWGADDFALTEEQMTDSVQYCTGPWRYERIDDAGHWMQLTKPDVVNGLLLDFLPG